MRAAAVYIAGSFSAGEPVYGLSDVDVVAVAPADTADGGGRYELLRQRRDRFRNSCLTLSRLVTVSVYHDVSLREAIGTTCLTYGLRGDHREGACLLTRPSYAVDNLGLRLRPKLPAPAADWRLFAGPERRPDVPVVTGQRRRIAAWLELQCWWRRAFGACSQPGGLLMPYLCLKLVAEAARVWLLVAHGRETHSRAAAVELGMRLMPEEEGVLQMWQRLQRALPRSPDPPLDEAVAFLHRTTARVAALFEREVAAAGVTEVSLRGDPARLTGERSGRPPADPRSSLRLPLLDWRAVVSPRAAEEWMALVREVPIAPRQLGDAARRSGEGAQPAILADPLLLLPTDSETNALLRAVQSRPTDPVSFALHDGSVIARFPRVDGWSAEHWSRRAVAEHRAWLTKCARGAPAGESTLALLFTAARAAFFLDTLSAGRPELMIGVDTVAEATGGSGRRAHVAARDALESYHTSAMHGLEPSEEVCSAFRAVVLDLPQYRSS